MKKILILSANMGHGHMSAAKSIREGIEHLYDHKYEVEIVDLMEILNHSINRVSQKTYDSLSRRAPIICDFIFESWDKQWKMKLLNRINYALVMRKMKKFVQEKQPDLVISTFPVWDYLMRKILKKQLPAVKYVSVVTDSIFVHNAWITGKPDEQIVPNQDTAEAIVELGFDPQKIKVLGFPVRLDFLKPLDIKGFLQEQQLNPDQFTILFLPTAQSPSKNIKTMEELIKNFQNANIIVIAGRDTKIKNKMEEYALYENVKIIGWTDRMPDFIKAADLVLTKAGGATVMECVAAQKPMIITSTIARHERGNAELVKRHKLGIVENKHRLQITANIKKIRENYKIYQKNLKKLSNPTASLTIAKHLIQLLDQEGI
jgi:UDP-N-acetylglucosamine:LPS N-acetylglucosamine transferase